MVPLALDDDQMQAVLDAARPLPPDRRNAFLHAVAAALRGRTEIGDGLVGRTIRDVQRQFFDPPNLDRAAGEPRHDRKLNGGKYSR